MLFAHQHTAIATACTLAFLFAASCTSTQLPDPRYAQPANLLEIVNEFQRLSRKDVYRFNTPKDITGTSILKATLMRLADFQRKHGNGYNDIVAFTRATAYERLREYDNATRHYRVVARGGGALAETAKHHLDVLGTFQRITDVELPKDDPFEYTRALDDIVRAWNALSRQHAGTSLAYLAQVEAERIDRAKVAFVELNRHRLNDGNELVVVGYGQLLSKHKQSKNYHRHMLDFGDYYVSVAREYSTRNEPEGLEFEIESFKSFAQSALKLYVEVAQQDGAPEKLEANGKIKALKGLIEQMTRRNR